METPNFSQYADGSTMIRAPFLARDLPPVGLSDIARAWDLASKAAELGLELTDSDPQGVIFEDEVGDPVKLKFDDFDAHCWATAIHRTFDLATIKGLSICFRMLALHKLMSENQWVRLHFAFDRKKTLRIDKALMAAAAAAPLNTHGLFDADDVRREIGEIHLFDNGQTP